MSGMLRRRSVFAAKIEGTVGTAESLAAADAAFNAFDVSIQPNITMTRREKQGGFNHLPGTPEGMQGTCTVSCEISYDGTNIPTWASVLLPACGWVAASGVFTPRTAGPGANVKTVTLGHYKDGKLAILSGAMGTYTITLETGKVGIITFTFTGKYSVNETDTALLSPTYPTAKGLRFAEGAFTFNSVPLRTASATIDAGNTVVMREDVNAADRSGFISAIVTNRAPIITADPESVLVATQDRDALWLTSQPEPLLITINGPADSTIVISAPEAQLENKQQGARNDINTDDLTWLATANSTVDTELSITFNADT